MPKFVLLFFILPLLSYGQTTVPQRIRAQTNLSKINTINYAGGGVMPGIALPPGNVIGDTFLNETWNVANVMLSKDEKMLEGLLVKYDLKNDLIEVRVNNEVKVIEGKKVKSIVWLDSVTSVTHFFINARDYHIDGVPTTGFVEVLVDGTFPLFKKTVVVEKEPNYIKEFDVGSRDTKLLKHEFYYYLEQNNLIKIKNKKTLLPAFKEKAADVDKYIKVNALDVKDPYGLRKVFEYYNNEVLAQR